MRNTTQSVEHNIPPQTNQPTLTAIRPQGSRTSKKGKQRSDRPEKKKKLKAVSTKWKAKETEVSINTPFLKVEASGNVKRCRGKTLAVKVRPTANAQCSLEQGVMKHAHHDEQVHEGLEYVLLYPDHSEVVNLPGTTDEFIPEKYRGCKESLQSYCAFYSFQK